MTLQSNTLRKKKREAQQNLCPVLFLYGSYIQFIKHDMKNNSITIIIIIIIIIIVIIIIQYHHKK